MATYRVYATITANVYYDIEADSADEAYEEYEDMDDPDFLERTKYWSLTETMCDNIEDLATGEYCTRANGKDW